MSVLNNFMEFDRFGRSCDCGRDDLSPICDVCGKPIREDFFFYYNDTTVCPDCEESVRDAVWDDIRDQYIEEVE